MKRIPLSLLVGISLICLPFFQLHAEDTGLDRKFNGSSVKSAEKCIDIIKSELSEIEFKVFSKAYGSIALKWAEENGGEPEDEPDWFGLMRRLDGMRVSEIINMAAREDLSFAEPTDGANKRRDTSPAVEFASGSTEAELNQPFVIDDVEVIISNLRIGELNAKKRQSGTPILPKDKYLIATVSLKNTTEGKIIVVRNAWQHVTLKDNFDNLYGQPVELPYFLEYVEGVIFSQELRSGEEVTDLLILPKPLDNAKGFTLSGIPGFYRTTPGGLLEPLSEDSFQIEFSRDDIR